MAEIQPRLCRHCFQEIHPRASICHHCSRVQAGFLRLSNVLRIGEVLSFFLSGGLLAVAFLNFFSTRDQLSKAEEALKRAKATEASVLEVADCIVPIAEILPRTGGFGGGLRESDQKTLQKNVNCLKNLSTKINTK